MWIRRNGPRPRKEGCDRASHNDSHYTGHTFCRLSAGTENPKTKRAVHVSHVGKGNVHGVLRVMPWSRWGGRWPSSLGDGKKDNRLAKAGGGSQRRISGGPRGGRHPWRCERPVAWVERYAGVGARVLENGPGTPGRSGAAHQKPDRIYPVAANQIAVDERKEGWQRPQKMRVPAFCCLRTFAMLAL